MGSAEQAATDVAFLSIADSDRDQSDRRRLHYTEFRLLPSYFFFS
jgi:hypothetical protein